MRQGPRSTPTRLHYWSTRTKQHKGQDLHRAPPWAWLGHLLCNIGTYKPVLEVSMSHTDSANLAPSRSRLFKLMGRVKGMRWSCSKRLAYMVANIRKWEREEKARHERKTMIKKWSYNNLRQALLQHRVHFPDSAEKRPSRLHTRLVHFN